MKRFTLMGGTRASTLFLCVSVASAGIGCRRDEEQVSNTQQVYRPAQSKLSPVALNLPLLNGIQYAAFESQAEDSKKKSTPESYRRLVHVTFPKLTSSEFSTLRSRMPFASNVSFLQGHAYRLTDFLPKVMQAFDGHQFRPVGADWDSQIPNIANDRGLFVQTFTNCWGLAFEFLRDSPRSAQIFFVGEPTMKAFFADASRFQTVGEEEARLGDLLMVWSKAKGNLLHVAVRIDKGLYFEKTNADGSSLFRMVTEESIRSVFKDKSEGRYELRRYVGPRIVDVSTALRPYLAANENLSLVSQIEYEFDAVGRARIPRAAYDSGYFMDFMGKNVRTQLGNSPGR